MSKDKKKKNTKSTQNKNTEEISTSKNVKKNKKEEKIKVIDEIIEEEELIEEIEDEELDLEEESDEEEFDEEEEEKEEVDEDLEEEFDDEEEEEIDEVIEEEVDEEEFDEEEEKEIDEDLEEEVEEEEEFDEPIIVEVQKKKEEKPKEEKKSKDKTSKEKIEKIEKIAKEKNKKAKTKTKGQQNKFLTFFEKNHVTIFSFIAGVLITTLIVFIIWPDRIATLKDGTQPVVKVGKETYTADELYESMKDYYSVSLLLDDIDNDLLTKLYPEDDEMKEEVDSNAEYYFNMYEQYYGYTQEEFLSKNGFSSYNAFIDYLKLDYRRNKYLDDYVEDNLTDEEIQKYYDENVFGDINTQHVLVPVSSSSEEDSESLSNEDAKKLAEEIITKLNDGTSWETIQKDYKDKITYEDLSYQSWDASLEKSFMDALKGMDDNTYSEEPVQTSYGYHVIYRIDQKKQPSLKESKEKIIENLISNKKSDDSNLLYKALISLRNEKKIDFSDTVMKDKYDEYCEQYK